MDIEYDGIHVCVYWVIYMLDNKAFSEIFMRRCREVVGIGFSWDRTLF